MPVRIEDVTPVKVENGQAVRFSVVLALTDEYGIAVEGWMVYRQADGTVVAKPPRMLLRRFGRQYYYSNIKPQPKLVADLGAYLEKHHGDAIWGNANLDALDKKPSRKRKPVVDGEL